MVFLVQYKVYPVNTGLPWTNHFLQQPIKGVETGVCQNKSWRQTYTRWQQYFKQKIYSLTSQKVCFDWKQQSSFNMIYFLLEKVIKCAQMPVDCLRASKLMTLWYEFDSALFVQMLHYFGFTIQLVMLRAFNVKV